ncbi:metal ABC transporter permease [Sciscionella sediminilitoris]|uniref:metal ABC transporter permease n=1 Tax=Sciscionella sediminilitoris TaxID=1445613 RepID=UPI0004DFCA4D|nr:metal ABC transporter permease [Sciscionella sp. SE31]
MGKLFDFGTTGELLGFGFVQQALLAGALLGLVAGLIGPLIVARGMAFSVHATSEIAFAGGAAALLAGIGVQYGALGAAVLIALALGLLARRGSERDSVIGAVLSFGLGIGILLLWLYPGRGSNKFGLLVGQIISLQGPDLTLMITCTLVVLVVLALIYRPVLFSSVDPEMATARGVPTKLLNPLFAVLVGVATSLGVQTVGALLVVALMITPGAAAARVSSSPLVTTVLAVIFAEVSMLGGIVLSLAPGAPVSAFVTTISFLIYLGCRVFARTRPQYATPAIAT